MDAAPVDIVDRGKPKTVVIEVESDTCDACGSRAYVYVTLKSGGSVAYCGHHGTVWWERLNELAADIIDMRHTIGVTFDLDDDE